MSWRNQVAITIDISKFSKKLQRLPIPQLIALITFACNQAGSIVPSCKHLQFTCNAWGNCNLGFKIVTALQVLVTLDNYCGKVQSNCNCMVMRPL